MAIQRLSRWWLHDGGQRLGQRLGRGRGSARGQVRQGARLCVTRRRAGEGGWCAHCWVWTQKRACFIALWAAGVPEKNLNALPHLAAAVRRWANDIGRSASTSSPSPCATLVGDSNGLASCGPAQPWETPLGALPSEVCSSSGVRRGGGLAQ